MAICRCRLSLLPDSRCPCQSHWTPTSSHNSAMEATGSTCKRRSLEYYHLSLPSPWPAACAGPACMCVSVATWIWFNVWDHSVWVLVVFKVMQFVTMHPVFKSLSVVVCDHSVVCHLLAILCHHLHIDPLSSQYLGWAWGSPTLAWLHCTCAGYGLLLGPTLTVNHFWLLFCEIYIIR